MKREKLEYLLYNKVSIVLFPFILLLSFCYLGNGTIFEELISIFSYVISFIIVVIYILDFKYSKLMIWLLLFVMAGLFSSLLGENSSVILMLKLYSRIVSLSMFLDLGFRVCPNKILRKLNGVFFILVFINFLTIVLFPNGLYSTIRYTKNWFFMYENTHIFMYFPALIFSYLNLKLYGKRIQFYILLSIISYCVLICHSATSLVALGMFIIFVVFEKPLTKLKILSPKSYFLIFISIFVGIVILRLQDIFSWFIVDVLGKNLTLTDRTYIWDKVILLIKDRFVFGYGMEPTSVYSAKLGKIFYTHAHNTILDIMYKGGIVQLFCFLQMIFACIKELTKNKKDEIIKILSYILLCVFVMINFEARQEKIGLYVILLFCYYGNNFTMDRMKGDKNASN